MVDKNRVRLMTRMAIYENNDFNEDHRVSSYYKKDYVSFHILITVLWLTLTFMVGLVIYGANAFDFILSDLSVNRLVSLATTSVGAYVVLIVIYAVIGYHYYGYQHNLAKQRIKRYYRDLSHLEKVTNKERRSR